MSTHDQDRAQAPTSGRSGAITPRLVVGDDGSSAADVVWQWVDQHPWPGWRICVLTARPRGTGTPVGTERSEPHPWDPPHPRSLSSGQQVEHLLAEADPRLAIDSCSDAALVVVGPRGRGLLKFLHIGSTTEWLVGSRRPLAPVVVVRTGTATRKVLLCTDGSDHAAAALEALLALPWLSTCRVLVLGVDDDRHTTGSAVQRAVAALREHGVEQVEHDVVQAVSHTAEFDVRSVILSTIAERSPDLVAVGARGAGGIRGMVVGSVTDAVVHHAPCSVLVAKAG